MDTSPKKGFVIVRSKVRRGGRNKEHIMGGRRPRRKGISYIKENYREVETLVTSGTIKKCKKFIELHKEFTGKEVKEISALF